MIGEEACARLETMEQTHDQEVSKIIGQQNPREEEEILAQLNLHI